MNKRLTCILLAALLLFSLFAPCAAAAHTHHGSLQSIKTEAGQTVPCCGVFRCDECGASYEDSITGKNAGMPVVRIEGDLGSMSKENKVTARLIFDSADAAFTTNTTMKWQGDSSLRYPKKNYSLSFITESGGKNKIEVRPEWGKQSKYCLKANWVDFSAARNIVSARLWGQVLHSECRDDGPDALLNGGAVDGFPVLLFQNGVFQGLYTFNMPKDKWIYGMGSGAREGLIMANGYGNCCTMAIPMADTSKPDNEQWEVEYCSTEDDPEGSVWLCDALNELITSVANLDGEALRAALAEHMDVERAIDYLLFITLLRAEDNRAKNIMWATYDGVKFSPLAYDLEGSWGMNWNGSFVSGQAEAYGIPTDTRFLEKMIGCYSEELRARYAVLRESVFTYQNIASVFNEYAAGIPAYAYEAERNRWPTQPGVSNNTVAQCLQFARRHISWLDTYFNVSVDEKTNYGYRAAFSCLNGAKTWLPQANGEAIRSAEAFSVDDSGALTKTNGQISFRVTVPDGCVSKVQVLQNGNYAALLGPEQTGMEGAYRITGVSGDLTVRVTAEADAANADGYQVSFVCPAGVRVLVYPSQDYNAAPTESLTAISVDGDTGIPTKSGDGQINFMIVSDNPNDLFKVSASPKNYKKLKGYEETCVQNLYRMTKITGDMTLTIEKDLSHTHDYTYSCAQVAGNAAEHRLYCACGQFITEPHAFTNQTVNNVSSNVCTKCGYRETLSKCSHICHSDNPFFRVIWKIQLFFFKLFRVNRLCQCGETHY